MTDLAKDMGPDAPMIVHENGSKESLCPFALDVAPRALGRLWDYIPGEGGDSYLDWARRGILDHLARHLNSRSVASLLEALRSTLYALPGDNFETTMLEVARVLEHGDRKYGGDLNWRGIPVRQHLRHALAHLFAHEAGDRSEGEWGHLHRVCCRLLFAVENELTDAEIHNTNGG